MESGKENLILGKSENFALEIIELYKDLTKNKNEFVLSKQLLRSGTSIGANARESVYAQSKPDFINKMAIALKEASESGYWLRLLGKSGYIEKERFKILNLHCEELIKLLTAIINTSKAQM